MHAQLSLSRSASPLQHSSASPRLCSCVAMPVSLRIRGVPVDFPFKPYPAQLALMDRLIKVTLHTSDRRAAESAKHV